MYSIMLQLEINRYAFHIAYISDPSAIPIVQHFQCVCWVCVSHSRHTSPVPSRQTRRFKVAVSPRSCPPCNLLLKSPSARSPLFPPVQFNKFNSTGVNWASAPWKGLSVKYNKEGASVFLLCGFSAGEGSSLPFPKEPELSVVSLGTEAQRLDVASVFVLSQASHPRAEFLCTCPSMHTRSPPSESPGQMGLHVSIFFQQFPSNRPHSPVIFTNLEKTPANHQYMMTSWKIGARRVTIKGTRYPQSNARVDILAV